MGMTENGTRAEAIVNHWIQPTPEAYIAAGVFIYVNFGKFSFSNVLLLKLVCLEISVLNKVDD